MDQEANISPRPDSGVGLTDHQLMGKCFSAALLAPCLLHIDHLHSQGIGSLTHPSPAVDMLRQAVATIPASSVWPTANWTLWQAAQWTADYGLPDIEMWWNGSLELLAAVCPPQHWTTATRTLLKEYIASVATIGHQPSGITDPDATLYTAAAVAGWLWAQPAMRADLRKTVDELLQATTDGMAALDRLKAAGYPNP
jgi:hypothetical protein